MVFQNNDRLFENIGGIFISVNFLEESERIFMEVTNHCNFRCVFCPQAISKRIPQHMNITLAKNVIQQLYEAGYKNNLYFHLLGEPLLYPSLSDIIKYATDRIPRSILFTNGSLLTNRNIRSIFDSEPYELMISVQTVDEESYELRGTPIGWIQYVSRIRDTVKYKLAHDTPTLLRISVGMRKEDSPHPRDEYFPQVTPSRLRENVLTLLSDIPGLNSNSLEKLGSMEIPFSGKLELASGISISIKPMGNWRRIYRDEKVEKGYCPHVGKEFGILSNGNIVLCNLDYDGKTTFANMKDNKLSYLLSILHGAYTISTKDSQLAGSFKSIRLNRSGLPIPPIHPYLRKSLKLDEVKITKLPIALNYVREILVELYRFGP
jgi:organic radical activating enzyme